MQLPEPTPLSLVDLSKLELFQAPATPASERLKVAVSVMMDDLAKAQDSMLREAFRQGIHPGSVRFLTETKRKDDGRTVVEIDLDLSSARAMTRDEHDNILKRAHRLGFDL
jgi:hypothetical protein